MRRGLLGIVVVAAAAAKAQLNNLDEALRTTPITTLTLAENSHVLFGVGGNLDAFARAANPRAGESAQGLAVRGRVAPLLGK